MNKKITPLELLHILLLVAGFLLMMVAVVKTGEDQTVYGTSFLTPINNGLLVIALLAAMIYLGLGYSKNAAAFYKCFMFCFMVSEGLLIVAASMISAIPGWISLLLVIGLTFCVMLTTCKDLGKRNTVIAVTGLTLCKAILLIYNLPGLEAMGAARIGILANLVARLLLAVTAGVMVLAKYRDKAARGSK